MRKPKRWLTALFLGASTCALFGQALQQLPTVFLEQGDFFGISADINGNGTYVVAGAPFHRNYADATDQKEGVAFVYTLSGGGWTIQDTLDLPTLTDMDGFGTAVSINTAGNLIAVGIPGPGNGRGDARLFKRSGSNWGMLASPDHMGNAGDHTGASPGDHFGAVLTLDGSGYYMAVGSPATSNAKGRANVCWFNADPLVNDWQHYASFDNPTPDKSDLFGMSLAIDANALHLIIGAPGEDNGNGNNNETDDYGAVYYYQRNPLTPNTWTFVQKINPDALQPQSQFGTSVDINSAGDSLIIGAPGHGGSGAAFLYKRIGNAWVQTDVIQSYNPDSDETFGASVAMSGTGGMTLVGAPLRDTSSITDLGSVFAFQYVSPSAGWTQFKNFSLPPGAQQSETFGSCVSLARNDFTAVIGSPFRNNIRGAAFVLLPTALPVTWLSFRAVLEGDDVKLSWSTASESNNEGFNVQRSENGRDWQTIAFVPGAGTTSEVQKYEYTDNTLSTLNSPLAYYRLQQRDYDGTTDFSPVRVVELSTAGGIRIFPNPADEVATIAFGQPTEARGWIRLLNGNGRLLAEHTIPIGTTAYELRVAQLPAGTYLLEIKVGVKEWTRRLVVE